MKKAQAAKAKAAEEGVEEALSRLRKAVEKNKASSAPASRKSISAAKEDTLKIVRDEE